MPNPDRFRLTAPVPIKLRETYVISACLDILRLKQYWCVRLHAGTFKSLDGRRYIKGVDKGTPDYLAAHEFYPAFLVEFKRSGGVPTPDQVRAHEQIRIGYRIATAAVDSVEALSEWLQAYEGKWPRGP